MRVHACESTTPSPATGSRLLASSLAIAGSVLLVAWMGSNELSPLAGAGVLAVSCVAGGLVLRNHARVLGLPLFSAMVMAVTVLVATALSGANPAIGGGVMFMALLTATTARTRASGLLATAILATAQVVAALI